MSEWQGVTHIHIHTYYNSNGGAGSGSSQLLPTKKGVALTIEEWKDLKAYIDHVDAMIAFSEDECILGKNTIHEQPPAPWPPQSLLPEACQYKPPSAASIGRQLSQIRKVTPYQKPYKPEPFDQ